MNCIALQWLGTLPHKHKIIIAGNHDITFEEDFYEKNWKRFYHSTKEDPAAVKALITNAIYLEVPFLCLLIHLLMHML
jgi:hypothetical protein